MSNCPPVTPAGCVYNFTPGRPGPVTAIYLHGAPGPLEYLDEQHKSRITPSPSGYATAPKHSSFHFAVGTVGEIHSFVDVADTAWAFGVSNPTLDPTSINIVLPVGFKLSQNACLPGSQWSKDQFNSLVNEICCLLKQLGLTANDVQLAPGELDTYPITELQSAITRCLSSSESPYPIGTAACLPPHAQSNDSSLPVAAWDGNCLVGITRPGTATACDYTTGPVVATDKKVTHVVIDGTVFAAPNGGIPMDQVVALSQWLNSLGMQWTVTLTAPNNVATAVITLLQTTASSVVVGTETGTVPTTSANCGTVSVPVSVTIADLLALGAVTYAGGTIFSYGVPVVVGTLLTDVNGVPQGYLMPLP